MSRRSLSQSSKYLNSHNLEIEDSWETIIENINNGSYETKYQIGDYKPLDLGPEGIINMQLVGIKVDKNYNNVKIPTTWIAKEALPTPHCYNTQAIQYKTHTVENDGFTWIEDPKTNGYKSNIVNISEGKAEATVTLTPSTDGQFTIMYKVESEKNCDKFTMKVNNIMYVNELSGYTNWVGEGVDGVANKPITVSLSYTKDKYQGNGTDTVYIKFLDFEGEKSIEATTRNGLIVEQAINGTGAVGGFLYSELFDYCDTYIKGLIPDVVRANIKNAYKDTYIWLSQNTSVQSTQYYLSRNSLSLWIPSIYEIYPSVNPTYSDMFKTQSDLVRTLNGSDVRVNYWCRDAIKSSKNQFYAISDSGGALYAGCQLDYHIVIGFCL